MRVAALLAAFDSVASLQLGMARAAPPQLCRSSTAAVAMSANGLDADLGTSYYEDKLCASDEEEEEEVCNIPDDDEFTVAILGDLHLDPRKMEDYFTGREHFEPSA